MLNNGYSFKNIILHMLDSTLEFTLLQVHKNYSCISLTF